MDTLSPDPSCLGSVDIEMENSVANCWNDEGFTDTDERGTSEKAWLTTINNDPVISPHAEGAAHDDTPCIQRIEPNPDDSLALVVSDSNKRIYNSIVDAPDSAVTVYDRRTKRRREDGVSMVETTTGNWCGVPLHVQNLPFICLPIVMWSRRQDVACSSRFPTEIYERIIDYITEGPHFDGLRHLVQWRCLVRYLADCALVCRTWVPRAQMHLFSAINLSKFPHRRKTHLELTSFRAAVQRKPFLLQYIKFLCITNDSWKLPQTTILSSYHMPSLKACCILSLNLTKVHPSLYRFPSSAASLQLLSLTSCETGNVNQLCQFLTSFRALSIVTITWVLETDRALGGRDLPHLQFNRSKCSLRALALSLGPNLSTLLKTFIKARPFVSHLKHLILAYHYYIRPSLRDITELLEHCSPALEEVTVILGYWEPYPVYSLSSISPSMYTNVSEQDSKLFTDEVGRLDDILSGEMFHSFRKLRIRANVKPIGFPKLDEQLQKVDVDFSDEMDWISY